MDHPPGPAAGADRPVLALVRCPFRRHVAVPDTAAPVTTHAGRDQRPVHHHRSGHRRRVRLARPTTPRRGASHSAATPRPPWWSGPRHRRGPRGRRRWGPLGRVPELPASTRLHGCAGLAGVPDRSRGHCRGRCAPVPARAHRRPRHPSSRSCGVRRAPGPDRRAGRGTGGGHGDRHLRPEDRDRELRELGELDLWHRR